MSLQQHLAMKDRLILAERGLRSALRQEERAHEKLAEMNRKVEDEGLSTDNIEYKRAVQRAHAKEELVAWSRKELEEAKAEIVKKAWR